eukprot:4633195-Amphidinium_carterae.2
MLRATQLPTPSGSEEQYSAGGRQQVTTVPGPACPPLRKRRHVMLSEGINVDQPDDFEPRGWIDGSSSRPL